MRRSFALLHALLKLAVLAVNAQQKANNAAMPLSLASIGPHTHYRLSIFRVHHSTYLMYWVELRIVDIPQEPENSRSEYFSQQ